MSISDEMALHRPLDADAQKAPSFIVLVTMRKGDPFFYFHDTEK
jgi:hypothetical protein